jgi:hypothetical protein
VGNALIRGFAYDIYVGAGPSTIDRCMLTDATTDGVLITNTSGDTTTHAVTDSILERNFTNGVDARNNVNIAITRCILSRNGNGVLSWATVAGVNTSVNVKDCTITANGAGIVATGFSGSTATLHLSNNLIAHNGIAVSRSLE